MRLRHAMPAGIVLLALATGAGLGAFRAAAEDAAASACPKCCKPGTGDKCADDGTALVPAELVGLHIALTKHSMDKEVAPGISNPLLRLTKADGSPDIARLKKLVSDYDDATKKTKFGLPAAAEAAPGGGDPPDLKTLEASVEAGLRWLARHQAEDGHWSATEFGDGCKGDKCDGTGIADFDVGLTGLVLTAFLDAGYTPQNRAGYADPVTGKTMRFGTVVKNAVKWLIDQQAEDGSIGPKVGEMMYNHALGTLALTELFGITNAKAYQAPAQKAVNFLHAAQNTGLGWRYTPKCNSNDTSVTAWCILALKSAQISGLEVAQSAFDGAKAWVNRVTDSNGQVGYDRLGSGEIYVPGKNEAWAHHPTMTAAGMVCRVFIDKKKGDPNLAKGAAILLGDLPKWDPKAKRPPNDFYYWHYATLALFHYDGPGGPSWSKWSKPLTDALLPNQKTKGCAAGSWDTAGVDRWAYAGGRVYGTAMNVITIEIPYRVLAVADFERRQAEEKKKAGAEKGEDK